MGHNHLTIGSDILSVLKALQLPEQTLGPERMAQLQKLTPKGWYPIGTFLDLMDSLHVAIGRYGMIKVGRTLFKMSHEEKVVRTIRSARQLFEGFDALYRSANRGDQIGGWEVVSFAPGRAELDKTTPHLCYMEEGLISAALVAIGVRALVEQTRCFRAGADSCRFVITSTTTDARWG